MITSTARRIAAVAAVVGGALFATNPAQASDVHWSVGISAPLYPAHVSTVISNGPYYAPPPVYVRPAPVYYYAPPPVYYRPVPVVVHRWAPPHPGYWHQRHYHDRWHDRQDRWHDRRGRYHDGWNRNHQDGGRR